MPRISAGSGWPMVARRAAGFTSLNCLWVRRFGRAATWSRKPAARRGTKLPALRETDAQAYCKAGAKCRKEVRSGAGQYSRAAGVFETRNNCVGRGFSPTSPTILLAP